MATRSSASKAYARTIRAQGIQDKQRLIGNIASHPWPHPQKQSERVLYLPRRLRKETSRARFPSKVTSKKPLQRYHAPKAKTTLSGEEQTFQTRLPNHFQARLPSQGSLSKVARQHRVRKQLFKGLTPNSGPAGQKVQGGAASASASSSSASSASSSSSGSSSAS